MNSTQYKISHPQIIEETFDDEVVIVDLSQGTYFSLVGSGSTIWNLALKGADESQIVAQIVSQTDADETELQDVTQQFLQQLQNEGLLIVADDIEYSNENKAAPETARKAFEKPQLQKFSDMQALLMLDPIHEVDEAGWPNVKAISEKSAAEAQAA